MSVPSDPAPAPAGFGGELRYFFTALGYFTRVPLPGWLARWVGFEPHYLHAAARYFPLVGLLVGGAGALVTWGALQWWPVGVAVLLGMAATLLLTGAFHEDGLADCVDAFGGAWQREDVLRIMHDSRIGAFGAIALVVALLLKWQLLVAIGTQHGAAVLLAVLVAAHAASRAMAVSYLATLQYVRPEGKAKPVAQRLAGAGLGFALLCGVVPLWLVSPSFFAGAVAALLVLRVLLGRYFVRRIGGYTGDCLGMAQQCAETLIYLVASAWTWS
ncbi:MULTISPECIES: adenosylcobinamide-GDP ribazoletransferase [unclassified Cupriavidus]|uniref:adenosylcobinamide-GDP ribazoletransferase n=1 Tax=unclassified Cupriavidus TaxID=2640874 RepID=UPI001055C962|nr:MULTISPECIES: adenosylcobinamide-GDP ribazoletransferase [unclassified Cupriavidus]MBF6986625.1 adenosylcobinamide-GDP ribazoletransferase [Cupriavidus sp. IK-TO18]TDF67770.1 adenosylcobinamide-GDP ribazoletransferase [Cupriavidus sp. L7L]